MPAVWKGFSISPPVKPDTPPSPVYSNDPLHGGKGMKNLPSKSCNWYLKEKCRDILKIIYEAQEECFVVCWNDYIVSRHWWIVEHSWKIYPSQITYTSWPTWKLMGIRKRGRGVLLINVITCVQWLNTLSQLKFILFLKPPMPDGLISHCHSWIYFNCYYLAA